MPALQLPEPTTRAQVWFLDVFTPLLPDDFSAWFDGQPVEPWIADSLPDFVQSVNRWQTVLWLDAERKYFGVAGAGWAFVFPTIQIVYLQLELISCFRGGAVSEHLKLYVWKEDGSSCWVTLGALRPKGFVEKSGNEEKRRQLILDAFSRVMEDPVWEIILPRKFSCSNFNLPY